MAKQAGPRPGSVSAALGNEKTKSNIICVSDCAAVTESKTDTSSSKQRDYSFQRLGACDNTVVADLVSVSCFIKALGEELYRCIMRNPTLGAGRAHTYLHTYTHTHILPRVPLAALVRKKEGKRRKLPKRQNCVREGRKSKLGRLTGKAVK